jgi:hypothetical protein
LVTGNAAYGGSGSSSSRSSTICDGLKHHPPIAATMSLNGASNALLLSKCNLDWSLVMH